MVTDERGLDRVLLQQAASGARVFGRDHAYLAQRAQSTQGNILEVADRRAD
jgi:hypothetical protein